MTGRIVSKSKNNFTVEVTVSYGDTMLRSEEHLQECLNLIGCLSTGELLEKFDSDGSPLKVNDVSLTSKGKEEKEYQSPYGPVIVNRHVYQSSKGGKTYVPLEIKSKTIGTVTPKFAKMITSKYSDEAAPGVQRDLEDNHGRSVSLSFIKKVTDMVGTIALAKEENWNYELPDFPHKVASIGVGLDGTCLNMKDDGWREAMCGTIAFFDKDGDRMHTIYTGNSPEYGKESFLYRFNNEIIKVKDIYSEVTVVGLADGASSNWKFLEKVCDVLTVDFWHVSEYLATAAKILFPYKRDKEKKDNWLDDVDCRFHVTVKRGSPWRRHVPETTRLVEIFGCGPHQLWLHRRADGGFAHHGRGLGRSVWCVYCAGMLGVLRNCHAHCYVGALCL